jgi:hypothetical protein
MFPLPHMTAARERLFASLTVNSSRLINTVGRRFVFTVEQGPRTTARWYRVMVEPQLAWERYP